ncbi:MAG: hypothetical protein NTX17_06830 [Candidatus Eisenbacteria bacterium]|nr:hypothetical protein [Candidatus Eisenbacteria bacterium]
MPSRLRDSFRPHVLPEAANERSKRGEVRILPFLSVLVLLAVLVVRPVRCLSEDAVSSLPCAEPDSVSCDSSSAASSLVSCSTPDASSRIAVYRFPSQVRRLKLPDTNIFVGSERVSVDGRSLSRNSYFLDCGKGELFLSEPVPPVAEIRVEYRYLPIYLKGSYCLRLPGAVARLGEEGATSLATAAGEGNPIQRELREEGTRSASSGLRLRGTKTLSLEVGSNRDATLRQSLDMNVTGEISKGLSLTAVLTDRDLPIQAEGRTEALNELDEIRVELQSQEFKAALGDCNFVLDGASLVNVSRKLEGAQARGTVKGLDVVLAGSTLKGKWVTRDFLGMEGRQGAYQLTTDAGASCVVIAGTEKVWLDGVSLRRGESADYWIDYGSGKLYFTNRRPITGYSRISVEYEYATGDYEKNFYAAGAGTNLSGGLGRVEFLVVSEGDQKALEAGSLTDEEERMLKELGDAPSNGTVEGAIYVGGGNGDYELISDDSTGTEFFRFVSEGGGSYLVSFIDVGENNGSYFATADTTGKVYYAYAGLGNAGYRPGRRLVAPTSKKVEDMRADVSVGGFDLKGEFALSQTDLNTFSSIGDDDNLGKAGTISLKSGARGISLGSLSLGRVSFEGNFRSIDEEFRTFGSINSPFEYENWALADSSLLNHGEKRLEARTNYSPWQTVTLAFQHGELSSTSGIDASRNVYSFERAGKFSVSGRIEKAASNAVGSSEVGSSRTVKSLGSRVGGWNVVPSISYYSEVKENDDGTGVMAEEVGGGLSSAWRAPLSVKIEERYRIEYLGTRANRTRSYDAITHSLGMEINRWRSVSASCEYSVRDLNGYNGLESVRTELGKLFVSQSTPSGKLSYEINHLVTTLNMQSRTKNIVYVGQNGGSYDSTGTFRGRGDYDVEIIDLASSALSADATTSATLALKPFRGMEKNSPLKGILEGLSSSSLFRSSGTLRGAPGPFSLLVSPMYTESPDAIRSDGLIREELEMTSFSKKVALRYRYELSRSVYHQYENVLERSMESRQGVRLRGEAGRALTVELEQLWRDRGREVLLKGGTPVASEAVGTETSLDLKYLPVRAIELSLSGSISGLRDADTGGNVRVSKFSPSATYGAGRSTRARLALTLSSYAGDVGVLAVGTAGAFVSPNRVEIVFSVDHTAGQHLTISSSVSSRKSTENVVTDGRVEMRAYF